MNVTIRTESNGCEHMLYLSGELDAFTAPQLKEKLISLVSTEGTKSVTIDIEQVSYIDSTGIGIIIGALKASQRTGCKLSIQNAIPRIERIFQITGLSEIISISPLKGEEA